MTDLEKMMEMFMAQAMKEVTPKQAAKPTPEEAAKKSATMAKQLYDAYLAEGFSEVQAFELVKAILTKRN